MSSPMEDNYVQNQLAVFDGVLRDIITERESAAAMDDESNNDNDTDEMRGDAIGNTLYSERFVLTTILKLSNYSDSLARDNKFKKDLCTIWDMTMEKDVVHLLLKYNAFEIFAHIIAVTENRRLTEILVGIMGNLCQQLEAVMMLSESPENVAPILALCACSDASTLVQVMRFLSTVLYHVKDENVEMWFAQFSAVPKLMDNFGSILQNSVNKDLLNLTLQTASRIVDRFATVQATVYKECGPEEKNFYTTYFIQSTIIALTTLFGWTKSKDMVTNTRHNEKAIRNFINIHSVLNYNNGIRCGPFYPTYQNDVIKCIIRVISPLSDDAFLWPLQSYHVEVIEGVSEILWAFNYPFDARCFIILNDIWHKLHKKEIDEKRLIPKRRHRSDISAAKYKSCYTEFRLKIIEYLQCSALNTTHEELECALSPQGLHVFLSEMSNLKILHAEGEYINRAKILGDRLKMYNGNAANHD